MWVIVRASATTCVALEMIQMWSVRCENQHIGKFQKLVDQRNEIAHPNGNIFFSDQATADQRIEEVMQQIRNIQVHMTPVQHDCMTACCSSYATALTQKSARWKTLPYTWS